MRPLDTAVESEREWRTPSPNATTGGRRRSRLRRADRHLGMHAPDRVKQGPGQLLPKLLAYDAHGDEVLHVDEARGLSIAIDDRNLVEPLLLDELHRVTHE